MSLMKPIPSNVTTIRPLYIQLKERIRSDILDGTYTTHAQMPSESDMVRMFNVSRTTVRQALRDLQTEGLIYKIPGKGSFVTRPKAVQELVSLQGFGEAMIAKGYETFSTVIATKDGIHNKVAAQKLKIDMASIMEIRRVRYLNREPISLDVTYVPSSIGRALLMEDLSSTDIFFLLENKLGTPLGKAELAIESVLSDEAVSRLLKVEEGSPILKLERLTYTENDRPIDYEHLYCRGDALKYMITLERRGRRG
ncbi:GntR family transcriptional regulator [Acidiferrobacter thiooxydans]|uniref:GntR family transcriptional regulator n=1 Tax=Acidiferrobacter thiooxydans TaxID=163359 RepID=A0A368HF65_9GAMM|nr:GntR family transcriptional regulator [Acidiferrobacter thiooxydans]RCN57086.1 GntR family transcriptional regulator [Acidiferrobacter thiooxydans]UEN99785.1 GntR family transcriptional regulator [Acidiferrobacter thiooxydans]